MNLRTGATSDLPGLAAGGTDPVDGVWWSRDDRAVAVSQAGGLTLYRAGSRSLTLAGPVTPKGRACVPLGWSRGDQFRWVEGGAGADVSVQAAYLGRGSPRVSVESTVGLPARFSADDVGIAAAATGALEAALAWFLAVKAAASAALACWRYWKLTHPAQAKAARINRTALTTNRLRFTGNDLNFIVRTPRAISLRMCCRSREKSRGRQQLRAKCEKGGIFC